MQVSFITYVYLVLILASILCIPWAIYKKDEGMLEVLAIVIPMIAIGFSCNYQVCPMIVCAS